jgi:pyruvate,water dikinase
MAMRSSAVGEDSRASFAGQYATILNVTQDKLGDTYKEVIAGKYAPEALHYRISYGYSDEETAMAVLVLAMVNARTSGVMYTADIGNPESNHMRIHAVWGLG